MAPAYSPHHEPRPTQGAVAPERLHCIGAARGLEPAPRPEHRADQPLVEQDWLHEQPRHPRRRLCAGLIRGLSRVRGASRDHGRCHALTCRRSNLPSTRSRSAARSRWRASAARELARMTSRLPAGSNPARIRATSRRRRRSRLRTTAPPTARVTTKPILGKVTSSSLADPPSPASRCAVSSRPRARLPWRTASSNSWRRLIRAAGGSTFSPRARDARRRTRVPAPAPPCSGAQAGPALPAARGHDRPARARSHAQPEPVRLRPTAVVRLKCALTHCDSRCC